MKYLLIEPKTRSVAPNIALMKFARWCENNNHEYQYVRGIGMPDIHADIGLMSCMFSYNSKLYEKTINHYLNGGRVSSMTVGGVFPTMNPKWFSDRWRPLPLFDLPAALNTHQGLYQDIENIIPKFNVNIKSFGDPVPQHNIVLYASRGCPNHCGYCAVPTMEGELQAYKSIMPILKTAAKELPEAKTVVLYDNNFTAHPHFENIVNELIDFGLPVDFCSGLHVESFTRDKAKLLSRLNWQGQGEHATPYIRFSFDKMKYFPHIKTAYRYIIDEHIKANMFLYVLFNYKDSPKDFFNKIQMIQSLVDEYMRTIFLFPMRYEPFMTLERHKYISPKWTVTQVRNLVKIYTETRNFLPITKTRNTIIKYLGDTEQEFIDTISKQKLKDFPVINQSFYAFFE